MRIRFACVLAVVLVVVSTAGCARPPGAVCTGNTVRLRNPRVLTVGVDLSYSPFAFERPGTGEPTGFEVELVGQIAKELGLRLLLVNRSSTAIIPGVLAHRHDLALSALRDRGRLVDEVCLSKPFLAADLGVLVARANAELITGAGDLDTRPIGVLRGGRADAWAKANPDRNVVRLDAPEDLFSALATGKVDAVVDELPLVRYVGARSPRFAAAGTIRTGEQYVAATSPDNKALMELVDAALAKLRGNGTLGELTRRWFAPREQ